MQIRTISKDNTNVIKGIAILSIMLHNLFHHIAPMNIGENEFYFSANLVKEFLHLIGSEPFEIINILFSFLGHYGVQLFIFISGYGLAMSMLKKNSKWMTFVVDRLKKLYPLLLTGIIVYILWTVVYKVHFIGNYEWSALKHKLLFIHTFLPNEGLSIVGPWWFFGLIFQLYLFFPFVYKLIKKYNSRAFLIICLICYIWIFISQYFYVNLKEVDLLQNIPGHLPEFAFGILFALNKDKKINNIFGILAAVVFVLGNYFHALFPFTFLSITYLCMWAFNSSLLKKENVDKKYVKRFLAYFGSLSMVLFAVHGFMRGPFNAIASTNNNFGKTLFVGFLFVVSALGVAIAANVLYKFLVKIFDKCIIIIRNGLNKIRNINITSTVVNAILIIALFVSTALVTINYAIIPSKGLIVEVDPTEQIYLGESSKLYLHLIDNFQFEKRQRYMVATISFDIKTTDKLTKLPCIVCSISKNNKNLLWKSIEIKSKTKLNSGEWETFSATIKLNVYGNPIHQPFKCYLYNSKNANFEYKNIKFKLEEI
ncbi:acyltransferase [Odoribacter sp. OttesenSCG-928-L07]|nr:acyltransferase [Odoribacter sp. OttesenSCG-928-L07]MDL2238611.1 acyltransferase [Bacteroidales bacterium OttesenSCG-928-L14]MDL2240511.1 acyltransferase [Bacteroidales bacterium OttesenSCG-928-K22]